MGSVWHATHLGLDVPCAVKFIEGELATVPEMLARFEREAKAAAQLRSPHVVQILDHGISDGVPYIAMELLEGEDLGQRIARMGRLPAREVVRIVSECCRALAKAHAASIVHRDLKPENIFLVRDDDREIVKVLDFGVAKAETALAGGSTRTGALLGTPYYMSPEQAQGTRSVDYRADLWSLAVIVYQCLTGQLPFESEALGDLLVKIIVSPIPVPSQVVPDLGPMFDQWWAKAASRDPAHRFQTAKDFELALALALGQTAHQGSQRGHGTVEVQMVAPGFGATPRPHATPNPLGHTTGAPVARTFAGQIPAPLPKKNGALYGLIAGGALLALIAGGVGIGLSMKKTPAAQPPPPTEVVPTAEKTEEPKQPDPPQSDPPPLASSADKPIDPPAASSSSGKRTPPPRGRDAGAAPPRPSASWDPGF
jgi:serine/threonine-protein kinase